MHLMKRSVLLKNYICEEEKKQELMESYGLPNALMPYALHLCMDLCLEL